MEPLPLIPRIESRITGEMGYIVQEVFQCAFQAEPVTWRLSTNLSKSCRSDSEKSQIALQIQAEIISHKEILDDLENAEMQIMRSQGYYLCRDHTMRSNERAIELIRLKRHPLYMDLSSTITEKYPLLQSDDLLPAVHENATDFRLNEIDRMRMKKRLQKSQDSLLGETLLPAIKSRFSIRAPIPEQKSRKITRNIRTKERLPIMRLADRKRSIIRAEHVRTVLVADPEELLFHNFQYNKMYKRTLLIKNVSTFMARYRIERRPARSQFNIFFDNDVIEMQKIAPGMHIRLTVIFQCNVIEDPEDVLIINVQSGKTLCVKMYGYRDPPLLRGVTMLQQARSSAACLAMDLEKSSCLLNFFDDEEEHEMQEEQLSKSAEKMSQYPKAETVMRNLNLGANFDCGECFVGERIIVPTIFVNEGGDGRFFIMSEIDWCSMNLNDIMDCNMIVVPPFALWPVYFTQKSGDSIEIRTYFSPESYGMQVDKLYMLCDNHAVHSIELIGDGILYDPNFIRFGDNIQIKRPVESNNKPPATQYFHIDIISLGEATNSPVFVRNTSGLNMYYRWEIHPAKYSASNFAIDWVELPIETLTIEPANGFLNSNSITPFKFIAVVENLESNEYRASARLYIEDIPLAAIPKDCDLRIVESRVKRRNCPITIDILVADIEVSVHRFPGKVYLHLDTLDKTDSETRYLGEVESENLRDSNYLTSSSFAALRDPIYREYETVDKISICGINGVQCKEVCKETKNSADRCTSFLNGVQKTDDTGMPAVTRTEFNHQTMNTAILIPDSILYVGMKQYFTLILRNSICTPVSYAWGHPPEKDECKMKVYFNPEKGLIPPTSTATIEVTCLPLTTGKIDKFYVPCFVGGMDIPIILGIECAVHALWVTFLFLPTPSDTLSPCIDSVRVEWRNDGHSSALNLNNLNLNRNSTISEEHELKNIDLDAGQVVATAAVGPETVEAGNVSLASLSASLASVKSKLKNELQDHSTAESESTEIDDTDLRSWESLLEGIVWTEGRSQEFISLSKPQAVVPFYKTTVPPITQAVAIEFTDLPLRTVQKRTVVIRNETPAESKFSITLKNFGPKEVVKELKPKNAIDATYASVMTGHNSGIYWENIKRPGKGVVLVIEPTNGNLASHESVPIDISVYADTWGVYVDEITIAICGLPDYIFGVCIQAVGSPVAYPICKTGMHKTPVLRFGTVNICADTVTRKILIENTSSVVLIINWHIYMTDPQMTEDLAPFNVILQMFSPFTNKIANTACAGLKSTSDIKKMSKSEFEYEELDNSDICDIMEITTTTESSSALTCYRDQMSYDSTISSVSYECCSESAMSDLDEDSVEYSSETESKTASLSNQTVDKETDLELTLTPYYGQPDHSVFTVTPAELVIPVRGKSSIEVTLNISKLQSQTDREEFVGRILGFIRVAPMHKYKADCFSRNDGALLTPTEIQLEVAIMKPMLSHEISQDDRTFKLFASSPITYFQKQIKIRRKYLFSNNKGEATFVNMQAATPFKILRLCTLKSEFTFGEGDGITVESGQCVEVDVLCSIDGSWLQKTMEIGEYKNVRNVAVIKNLVINHVGSYTQVVPLYLTIYLPFLKLSTYNIKFETVYIGDSKKIALSIENISSKQQTVSIKAKRNNKDFVISPIQGILSHSPFQGVSTLNVVVTFTATVPRMSVDILEISTTVPDYVEECIIEGCGSLDSKYNNPGT